MYRMEDLEGHFAAYRRRAVRERTEEERQVSTDCTNARQQEGLRRTRSPGEECMRAPEGVEPDDRDLALALMAMQIEQEQMRRRQEKAAARFTGRRRPLRFPSASGIE
jgi:hypothetical protein